MKGPVFFIACCCIAASLLITSCASGIVVQTGSASPPEVLQYANDWPLPDHDYAGTRAATNSSIGSGNVATLGPAWSFPVQAGGGDSGALAGTNPLITGGTVYVEDMLSRLYAIDLATGQELWSYDPAVGSPSQGPIGPAIGWGKAFMPVDLSDLVAIDLTTHQKVWDTDLTFNRPVGMLIQPVAYDGTVYASTQPGTATLGEYLPGGAGVLYGIGQATGEVRWSFDTIQSPDLWGHPEINSGGGAWMPPAIDTQSGTVFWGTGNPAPFPGTADYPGGTSRPGRDLYTDSLLALDHLNGSLEWFNQVDPHDNFDHDFQISPILATVPIDGTPRDIVIGAGKWGRVYGFDRATGSILWVTLVGDHNGNDELATVPDDPIAVLPGALGGVETPMAYADGTVYVTNDDLPTLYSASGYVAFVGNVSGGRGGITAIRADTGKVAWRQNLPSLATGGATVVNDLVFVGTYDGTIRAFNRTTGVPLWSYQAPAGINAWPAVAGDTLVWPCGVGPNASVIALRPAGTGS